MSIVYLLLNWANQLIRLLGTMLLLGLSLLPLSVLLVALPLVAPNEAVLSDTIATATSFTRRFARRLLGAMSGIVVLVVLLALAIEIVNRLPLPERGQMAPLARKILGQVPAELFADPVAVAVDGVTPPSPKDLYEKRIQILRRLQGGVADPGQEQNDRAALAKVDEQIAIYSPTSLKMRIYASPGLVTWLGTPIWKQLPEIMIEHWPFIILTVYALDVILLFLIGKVPVMYNVRNLVVRWRISGLTALAFTVVVALLVGLLAFVNGMYKINQDTGIPGNVFALSDGATDELFSNLGYGDVDNISRSFAELDQNGIVLSRPIGTARAVMTPEGLLKTLQPGESPSTGSDTIYLASKEIYFVVNQERPKLPGDAKAKRRFLNMRALENPLVAAAVHNVQLQPGGQWFSRAGVQKDDDGVSYIQCVLGEGSAGVLGEDAQKPQLERGDRFKINELNCIVVGIMKAEGTTFGSEIWVQNIDLITRTFGKKGNYTTLVLRTDANTLDAAKAYAYHLQNRYTQQKLKAFAEPDYYAELTRTNDQFLTWIVAVAIVMAIGGVFGVMNTQFASIASRIKEVGVLRILGFKRWQILISFMFESLLIAFIGGLIGCAFGSLMSGYEARSTLSGGGGGGGGKSISLVMLVNYETVTVGILFTIMMGRIGGLVPALSAMRMNILDSLK